MTKFGTNHPQYKHGHALKDAKSSTYEIWSSMKKRCQNTMSEHYDDYGGRGIKVCEKWQEFEGFLEDMGERPSPELSLDRIDNNQGYFKDNCRWATRAQQANNRRSTTLHHFNGQSKTLTDWSKEMGLTLYLLYQRIFRDEWTLERALTTPEPVRNAKYFLELNGEQVSLWEYCKAKSINHNSVTDRMRRGMTLNDAVTKPFRKSKKYE